MVLVVDTFHALARSSPWRWSRLQLRHTSEHLTDVDAWVVRPGWTLIRDPGQPDRVESGVPYSMSPVRSAPIAPQDVIPVLRSDGLVARRPDSADIWYDDPMYPGAGFTWVAMLDPAELSHHVEATDLVVVDRDGRETWWATLRAQHEYAARCADCCDLLLGGAEQGLAYRVGLDAQTGVVVSLHALEGNRDPWLENQIVAVDDDVVVPAEHLPRAVRGSAG